MTTQAAHAAPEYVLGYSIEEEAWYRFATQQIPSEDETVLMVGMHSATGHGGCLWEFSITLEPVDGGSLRVRLFDDAWQAFTAAPEFFAGLADLGRGALVGEVVELMQSLGYRDFTRRTAPA